MWYDVLVVCILLFFMVKGASRGLIWQLAGIAGILLCLTFAGTASKVIGPHINLAPPTNQWAVMFITYLLATFVAFGFARTLNGWIEKLELKEFNRHLGAVFGLLKGALLVLIMTFMIVTFSAKTRDMLKDSRTAQIAAKVIYQIEPVVPDKLHAQVEKYIDMFERTGFGKNAITEVEEALPDEGQMGGGTAPVGDDTTLGKAEPFDPLSWFSTDFSRKPSTPVTNEQGVEEYPDLATELQRTVGAKITRLIEDELRSASPSQKSQIVQDLTNALQSADPRAKKLLQQRLLNDGENSSLVQLLGDWAADTLSSGEVIPSPPARSSTPVSKSKSTTTRPATSTPAKPKAPVQPSNGPRTILDEIVATRSQFSSIQKKLKADYTQILSMVPEEVSSSVLQDWGGDLNPTGVDIDPTTDAETRIEERIIRQLSAHGFSETSTLPELQDRLKEFRLSVDGAGVLR